MDKHTKSQSTRHSIDGKKVVFAAYPATKDVYGLIQDVKKLYSATRCQRNRVSNGKRAAR
jgi:hypothetical protein